MQQYFKTGRTLVIDDQYNEAKPLLDALCKKQIPFLYTQGKPNSDFPLPNTDANDAQYYSLIFLDLNLDFKFAGGQIGSDADEKTFKSIHSQILNTIVKNQNRSFIILIWSNEEENYLAHFLDIFNNVSYTTKKPYKIISLKKSNFFSLTNNGYEFKKDANGQIKPYEDLLFDEIENALMDFDAFKFFCEWDRVVLQSVGESIDDFMALINDISSDRDRELHLAEIITAISIAYSGVEGYLKLKTNEEKTDSVLLALTQILNDDIDRNVLHKRQNDFSNWKAKNKDEIKIIRSKVNAFDLNRKLSIYKPNRKDLTGSIYLLGDDNEKFENIFLASFETSSISKDFIKLLKKRYKDIDQKEIPDIELRYALRKLLKSISHIELNISPLCDVVQNKIIYHRILKGIIIPVEYLHKIKKSDFFAITPPFKFEGNDVFVGFDFRTFMSCTKSEIDEKIYAFTLRANLINDIQTKLAAHVSRLGILSF